MESEGMMREPLQDYAYRADQWLMTHLPRWAVAWVYGIVIIGLVLGGLAAAGGAVVLLVHVLNIIAGPIIGVGVAALLTLGGVLAILIIDDLPTRKRKDDDDRADRLKEFDDLADEVRSERERIAGRMRR